jgi:hypothetical protein
MDMSMNNMQKQQQTSCSGRLRQRLQHILLGWLAVWLTGAWPAQAATPDLDLRTLAPITSTTQSVSYGLSVADCAQVKSVKVGSAGNLVSMDSSLAQPVAGSNACVYAFTSTSLNPQAQITWLDDTQASYNETFQLSTRKPALTFEGVSI